MSNTHCEYGETDTPPLEKFLERSFILFGLVQYPVHFSTLNHRSIVPG